jgi:photosystem II stability/assembly factor-like uncharacterized protein
VTARPPLRSTAARCRRALAAFLSVVALTPAPGSAQQPAADPALLQALTWRNVGPFRGGRVVAVAGVPTQPQTYYFGAVGGGVWKTEDAGISWKNVSDGHFRTSSVGALAVAESDPNVVYAGMGEHPVRGVMTSHGDGVYRSTDAGRSWTHLGLERTRQISAVRVHPADPDLVYVAAQGSPFGATPDRGIYRSRDGGRTWEKILYVDENSGASDLSMDMTNPRVLYAAFWDHRRTPWAVRSGGPGSGLYRSTDGGDSWTRLSGGLPREMGKTSISVSRADPSRVFALVEAEPEGGLYRSDDAGATWRRLNDERVLHARAWYYIKVFADPRDRELVYVLNAPMLKSIDGGRTFENVPVPHGDNHALWINPLDNRYLIEGNDGGANVSLNGARSWSTQENQPTAQFYRVEVDNRFPYHLYAGQQDNSTIATPSRTTGAGIGWKDWYAVAGCESAHLAFDPDDPTLVYGGCYQGIIDEYDHRTGQRRNIMAYPVQGLGSIPAEQRYRFNWNAPIEVSRHDPKVIYHAGNVLLRSEDRGRSWRPISPDLTRDEKEKQGAGGFPFTSEGAGGEIYNTIMYVAESPHDAGTIWVGTDDGLVHLTRDGGAGWTNVTPRGLPESQVNAIEVSPHDPATAYIAVTRYKFNDFTPHLYRTTDHGRSWTRIVDGIPAESWARVVREDPARRGLLYAGTETGVFVSFDAGARWQPLQLARSAAEGAGGLLPVVPVTDLKVKDADLVASTSGRAFWILDDLTPLRELDTRAPRTARLHRPSRAIRTEGGSADAPGLGRNPPNGAILYYTLPRAPAGPLRLEILDASGQLVRSFSSAPGDTVRTPSGNHAPTRVPARAGLNRFVWNLRHEELPRVPGLFVHGNLGGHRVAPGTYQVRLTVDGETHAQSLEVVPDPRYTAPAAEYAEQERMLASVADAVRDIHEAVIRMRAVRDQVDALVALAANQPGAEPVRTAGAAYAARITDWEEAVVQTRQQTFQDVINYQNRLNAEFLFLKEAVDGAEPMVTEGMRSRLQDLLAQWREQRAVMERLVQTELAAFNALYREHGVPAVVVPR